MEYRRFAPVAIAGMFVFGGCGKDSDNTVKASSGYELTASSNNAETSVRNIVYNMQLTPQARYSQLEVARASMGDRAFWNAAYKQIPALQQRPITSVKALGVAFVISAAHQSVEKRQQELVNGKQYNPRDKLDSAALNSMPGALVGNDGNTYVPVRTGKVEPVFMQVKNGEFYRIRNNRWEKVPSGDTVYTPEGQVAWESPRFDTVSGVVREAPHNYASPNQRRDVALSDETVGRMIETERRQEEVRIATERNLQTDPAAQVAQRGIDAATHGARAVDKFLEGLQNREKKK